MIEKFFTLKIWAEYIIPAVVIAIAVVGILVVLVCYRVSSNRWRRKERWLKNNGYNRYLLRPGDDYQGAIYEWQSRNKSKSIREDEAERMTYRKFIKKMEPDTEEGGESSLGSPGR